MPPSKTKATKAIEKPVEVDLLRISDPTFAALLVGNADAVDRAFRGMIEGLHHDMIHADPAIRAQARAFFLDRVLSMPAQAAQPQAAGGKTVHELMMRRVSGG